MLSFLTRGRVALSAPFYHMPILRKRVGGVARAQVISTALGYVLPNLVSRKATQHAASVLYTCFGLRLLWIAWHAKPQETNQARRSACTMSAVRQLLLPCLPLSTSVGRRPCFVTGRLLHGYMP